MTNSDQIKQAPEPTNRSRQIFRNFTDATAALLECGDTPADLREMLSDALNDAGNKLGGYDEYPDVEYRRVLLNIFGLNEDNQAKETEDDEADRAARELANAFATIEEYRDYLPAPIYYGMAHLMADCIGDAQWSSKPDLMRKVLPDILREAINEQF